ncbi:unnamed protein product [Symbiodinium sp. CCMP2592]|nr:unnamed protein product [Symbiodinium sp. CCMP2592]
MNSGRVCRDSRTKKHKGEQARVVIALHAFPVYDHVFHVPRGGTCKICLRSLRWLREHPPLPVPEIPAPDVTALAATGGLNGLSKVGDRSGDPPPEASVSRLAWSAADEWRRLAEVRSELERCRDQLAEHQAVLLHVGDAIHTEVDRLQEWERNVKMREDELGDVEKQLEGMRSEIQKQYLTQKRLLETMSAKDEAPASPRQLAAASTTPRSSGRTGLSALSPGREVGDRGGFKDGVDSSPAPALPWETRSQGKASAAGQRQPLQASAEEELISLQRGIEQKKRQLRVLEEEAGNVARPHSAAASGTPRTPRAVKGEASPQERLHPMLEGRLLSGLAPPPAPPPLDAAPPPVFGDDAGRARIRNPAHPGQCGGMPDRGFPTRSTVEAAVGSDPLLPEPPVFSSDTAGLGVGLLRAPPPPPAPPPSIALGGSHSSGPSASPKGADRARGSMPADFKKEVASPVGAAGMATTEELGQAMKQLFHAFASRAAGSVAKPGGGRAGRVALGLQVVLRGVSALGIGSMNTIAVATVRFLQARSI